MVITRVPEVTLKPSSCRVWMCGSGPIIPGVPVPCSLFHIPYSNVLMFNCLVV
jgi:hypothetical protein